MRILVNCEESSQCDLNKRNVENTKGQEMSIRSMGHKFLPRNYGKELTESEQAFKIRTSNKARYAGNRICINQYNACMNRLKMGLLSNKRFDLS